MPESPIRVALDGTPLTVSTGGVRRYVEELTAALRRNFPEDDYLLVSDQLSPPRSVLERRWWLWGLRQELRRQHISIFHGTDFAVPYLSPCRSVMTLHDLSPWREELRQSASPRVRRRTPLILRLGLATTVITPSEAIRREAISYFGIKPNNIVAVPLAASGVFHPAESAPRSRPYFLYVGTIEARKNIEVAVRAWRELRKSCEVDFLVGGRLRETCDLEGVERLGAVSEADLPALYCGAAAVVYPSLYEGFGLPVLEAMQCGTMVIASRDAAITETAGGAALQVEALDHPGWYEAMQAALNPNTRADYRERGLRRAAEFTWKRTAQLTREVYVDSLRRT